MSRGCVERIIALVPREAGGKEEMLQFTPPEIIVDVGIAIGNPRFAAQLLREYPGKTTADLDLGFGIIRFVIALDHCQ